jgi:hypothetical protein
MARWACSASAVLKHGLAALALAASAACEHPQDICSPVSDRIGFFSQGDCIFTRARFFRGHEWLTYFGNRELAQAERFDESEVQWMALGNRPLGAIRFSRAF